MKKKNQKKKSILKKKGRPKKTKAEDLKRFLIPIPKEKIEEVEGEVYNEGSEDRFGRPTVITPLVREKLLQAFAWGCGIKEAALFSGIAPRTVDYLFEKEPDFRDMCFELQDSPVFQARATLVTALAKSPYYALKYLERKRPEEFSLRVKQTFEEPEALTEEEMDAINEVIDENF